MLGGAIGDVAVIVASSLTKNWSGAVDPDIRQAINAVNGILAGKFISLSRFLYVKELLRLVIQLYKRDEWVVMGIALCLVVVPNLQVGLSN